MTPADNITTATNTLVYNRGKSNKQVASDAAFPTMSDLSSVMAYRKQQQQQAQQKDRVTTARTQKIASSAIHSLRRRGTGVKKVLSNALNEALNIGDDTCNNF